jgi:hypothetical protein
MALRRSRETHLLNPQSPLTPDNSRASQPPAPSRPTASGRADRTALGGTTITSPPQRALELAADFDDLANIERLQDQHRRELTRRQQLLVADQQTCDALQAHLAQRLDTLLRTGALLERLTDALTDTTEPARPRPPAPSTGRSPCGPA